MTASVTQLRGTDLRVHFDGVKAVDGVDFNLSRGEVLGLIGPNGAGKTTLLNALTGYERPTTGRVHLDSSDVTRLPAHLRARAGIVRSFQSVRVFEKLTALENVQIGALGGNLSNRDSLQLAWELLDNAGMGSRVLNPASSFPHGEERMLGILRALAMKPKFLLLDEPAAGLNQVESIALAEFLSALPGRYDLGLLIVEHDMRVIMSACRRIHVIDYGKTIAVGTPAEVQKDPAVQAAYLGTGRGTA